MGNFDGEDLFWAILGTVLLVVVIVLGCNAVLGFSRLDAEREAVEAGHAEYFLNADHERRWRWLEPCADRIGVPVYRVDEEAPDA